MIFSDKGSKSERRSSAAGDSGVTILTPGCHFTGKLYCRGASRIGGKIEGEVVSEGLLIIEEEAEIQAKITSDEAVVQGRVTGSLVSKKRVKLTESCVFTGDIYTPSLVVSDGALFNGRAYMESNIDHAKDGKVKAVKSQPVMGAVAEGSEDSKLVSIGSDLKSKESCRKNTPELNIS